MDNTQSRSGFRERAKKPLRPRNTLRSHQPPTFTAQIPSSPSDKSRSDFSLSPYSSPESAFTCSTATRSNRLYPQLNTSPELPSPPTFAPQQIFQPSELGDSSSLFSTSSPESHWSALGKETQSAGFKKHPEFDFTFTAEQSPNPRSAHGSTHSRLLNKAANPEGQGSSQGSKRQEKTVFTLSDDRSSSRSGILTDQAINSNGKEKLVSNFAKPRSDVPLFFWQSYEPFERGLSSHLIPERNHFRSTSTMVTEREPPKAPLTPHKLNQQPQRTLEPEFGKASPLRNPLQSNVFNIPKPRQVRPEHHRPLAPPSQLSNDQQVRPGGAVSNQALKRPQDPDFWEIPRPANVPAPTTKPVAQPTFSSLPGQNRGFAPVNPSGRATNIIDLTKPISRYDPDDVLFDKSFGASDPFAYVDTTKANENIKALLEGAFDDEDDKPRTRSQKKKRDAAADLLADKLEGLSVAPGATEGVDEEDEEEDDGTVEGLSVKLLPHQVDGVAWMKDKEIGTKKKNGVLPRGGILADDMGLGKTLQSISLILTNPLPSPFANKGDEKRKFPTGVEKCTLVVAPLALIKQWEDELNKRVLSSHKLRVCVHHGPQRTKRFQDLKRYDVVITTYQILVSEYGNSSDHPDGLKTGCFGLHWYRVILDEAHTIKNRNAKATQACYALKAEYRWCLTGTPMQNNLDELQSLIKFLRIKPYNDLAIWKEQITRPLNNGRGGVAIKRLQYILKAFMKRRTKAILLEEGALNPGGKPTAEGESNTGFKITKRQVEEVVTEFTPSERQFYDRLEQRTDRSLEQMMGGEKLNYASALVLLLRLRQACNHPQLVGGNLSKDRDALATSGSNDCRTPRKPKPLEGKAVDDIADMLGGLSVVAKKCDVCQIELEKEEVSNGAIRCSECEDDLLVQTKPKEKKKKHRKAAEYDPRESDQASRIRKHRPRVLDSDDEEEEAGEWIVPEKLRHGHKDEQAGGTDDEDAEGGGEWLSSNNSETEDESNLGLPGSPKHGKDTVRTDTSDEELTSDDDDTEEDLSSSGEETAKSGLMISAKIRRLLYILKKECAEHKFIVFSEFTSMLDLIEPFMKRNGISFTRYDGGMKNELREASLERLRNDKKTRVLLCSLKCGSLGLNLTAATRVVILEPFWNPFIEEQAIDRVHRLTQTIDVVVYKITVKDTVEERILQLQEKKRELANAAIEGKGAAKLSMNDIMHLFRRDAETYDDGSGHAFGTKTSILAAPSSSSASLSREERDSQGRRKSPSVMERTRVASGGMKPRASQEDSVFGRRW
ncbi:MAG: hypothetical protein M1819_001847 [Sarea resinae]|nr:MAG: hypothetical protein M1819_001847 [Sarea resinae]